MFLSFQPVLAAPDGFGWIMIALMVLGWFVKAIKDQQQKAPKPQERRNNPEQVRTEIQDFLDELAGVPPKRPPARPAPQRPPERPPERPRPPAAKTANKKQNKPAPEAPPKKQPPKPVTSLGEKRLPNSNLGSGIRTHISSYMTDRVDQEVKQDLKERIAEDVQTNLGAAQAAISMAPPKPVVHPLVALLRDPRGMRQAVLMQEILQKPKSLRRG